MGASIHLEMIREARVLRIREVETSTTLSAGPVIPDRASTIPITGNTKPWGKVHRIGSLADLDEQIG